MKNSSQAADMLPLLGHSSTLYTLSWFWGARKCYKAYTWCALGVHTMGTQCVLLVYRSYTPCIHTVYSGYRPQRPHVLMMPCALPLNTFCFSIQLNETVITVQFLMDLQLVFPICIYFLCLFRSKPHHRFPFLPSVF